MPGGMPPFGDVTAIPPFFVKNSFLANEREKIVGVELRYLHHTNKCM